MQRDKSLDRIIPEHPGFGSLKPRVQLLVRARVALLREHELSGAEATFVMQAGSRRLLDLVLKLGVRPEHELSRELVRALEPERVAADGFRALEPPEHPFGHAPGLLNL